MSLNKILLLKPRKLLDFIQYHFFEKGDVFIYWPPHYKAYMLLSCAAVIKFGHLWWYVSNFNSDNRIWLSESYYDYRIITLWCQITLIFLVGFIAFRLRFDAKLNAFMGWFVPLFFGLLLIYSAQTSGIYSPAAIGGILNILFIGFVFYQAKVIYSIMTIVAIVFAMMVYFTASGSMVYAPLFSEKINQSHNLYENVFWLKSMALLYVPILVFSIFFFSILIAQWRRREKKIEILSQMDGLTNVYNRRHTTDLVSNLKNKNTDSYGVIILDLDFFKKVNDTYGHGVGDQVLRDVAKILKSSIRDQDILGRFGGEEFVLILPNQDLEHALDVAERCRMNISTHNIILFDQKILNVTASFGVAIAGNDVTMDEVFSLADQALYLSKQKGRNTVSHYLECVKVDD